MNTTCLYAKDNILAYKLEGSLGTLEAPTFLATVMQDYQAGSTKGIILDCQDMPYLTSSGLRAIMTIGKTLKKDGGTLVLCALQGLALEIFTASGFASLFATTADLSKAQELLGVAS